MSQCGNDYPPCSKCGRHGTRLIFAKGKPYCENCQGEKKESNTFRAAFFLIAIAVLFSARLFVLSQLNHIILWPDECIYGFAWNLTDLSVYSIFPLLFGRFGGIAANCLISSACIIPIFYLVRKHQTEQVSAFLAALISFAGPLWLYSFMNVTEPLAFLALLSVAATMEYEFIPFFVKPLGIATFLATMKEKGIWLGIGLSTAYWFMDGMLNGGGNPALAILRSVAYILVASLGSCLIPIKRALDGQADKHDTFFLWLVAATFALLITQTVYLPTQYFYGRYFDGIVLFSLTFAYKPFNKSTKVMLVFGGIVFAAIVFLALLPQGYTSIIGDAGLAWVGDVIKDVILNSNYPIWKHC